MKKAVQESLKRKTKQFSFE